MLFARPDGHFAVTLGNPAPGSGDVWVRGFGLRSGTRSLKTTSGTNARHAGSGHRGVLTVVTPEPQSR